MSARRQGKVDGNSPTLHISQAISSYAPGNPVVKNEWVYEPSGIRLKTKYDDSTSRYIIQNCTHCGYTTITYGTAKNRLSQVRSSRKYARYKRYIVINGTKVYRGRRARGIFCRMGFNSNTKNEHSRQHEFHSAILLEMDAWQPKTNSARMSIRCSTPRSEILFYNKGTRGFGYAFCPYCGRMKSEQSPDASDPIMPRHKHLLASTLCPGGENDGAAVRRHVLLVEDTKQILLKSSFMIKITIL